jgi:hypothetical protein
MEEDDDDEEEEGEEEEEKEEEEEEEEEEREEERDARWKKEFSMMIDGEPDEEEEEEEEKEGDGDKVKEKEEEEGGCLGGNCGTGLVFDLECDPRPRCEVDLWSPREVDPWLRGEADLDAADDHVEWPFESEVVK